LIGKLVTFAGAQAAGENNNENRHEGYGGFTIDRIRQKVDIDGVLAQCPTVVLIHAGTNDIVLPGSHDLSNAPQRLDMLVTDVLDKCPASVILVAKIINCTLSTEDQAAIDSFNSAIPDMVSKHSRLGYKIRLVDQTNVGGRFLSDNIHPTDAGYNLMAQNWFQAFQALPDSWIREAQIAGGSTGHAEDCDKGRDSPFDVRQDGVNAARRQTCTVVPYRARLWRLLRSLLLMDH
jgi:lysophospholipase L1-like esterase